jgi:hypothetical protein
MEITISATLEGDSSDASISMATVRAIRCWLDNDSSFAKFDTVTARALRGVIDADKSTMFGVLNKLDAMDSVFGIDTSDASISTNTGWSARAVFNCDDDGYSLVSINKITTNSVDWEADEAFAWCNLNTSVKLESDYRLDKSDAKLKYLYLKNPPLPPEVEGGIRIRSNRNLLFNKSQLVVGNTYNLDAVINGQRIDGISLVFTVKNLSGLKPVILLQKSTLETPEEYLYSHTGMGDILLNSSVPVTSSKFGASQETIATIVIKPDEFKIAKSTALGYEFWAYDALGTNTLLEAGTFSVATT